MELMRLSIAKCTCLHNKAQVLEHNKALVKRKPLISFSVLLFSLLVFRKTIMTYLLSSLCSTPVVIPASSNSTITDLISPCLAFVAAPILPTILLAPICVLTLYIYGHVYTNPRLAGTRLVALKFIISTVNLIVSLVHLIGTFGLARHDPLHLREVYTNAFISTIFALFSLISYGQCIQNGIHSSSFLYLNWFLRCISLLPEAVAIIFNWFDIDRVDYKEIFRDEFNSVVFFAQLACTLIMLILLSWADTYRTEFEYEQLGDDNDERKICPDAACSTLNAITYSYAGKIIWKGLRSLIEFEDLWKLEKHRRAGYLRDRFYANGGVKTNHEIRRLTTQEIIITNRQLFIFFWRLVKTTWEPLAMAAFLASIVVIGRFVNASFLRLIVRAVSDQLPLWLTVIALVTLVIVDLFGKSSTCRRDFYSLISYLDIRSVLNVIIFDKMLRLSPSARQRYSAGEILNIVTTDVQRIRVFWLQLRDFIYCPFMLIAAFTGLFMEIGWNTCYGIIVLIFVLPINYIICVKYDKNEEIQMKYKDERLKLMNDILSGIKVLKLYAWEPMLQKMVENIRKKEMHRLRRSYILMNLINVSFQLGPVFAMVVSFYGYIVLEGNKLTPEVAFVSIMFFGMVQFAIFQIPNFLSNSVQAIVSGRRILRLLCETEQSPSHIKASQDPLKEEANGSMCNGLQQEIVVTIGNCSFTWDSPETTDSSAAHLKDINLAVRKGELLGIVGRVGSGKSSLLYAILGEMERLNQTGNCNVVANSIGYLPQQPWIQNKTLRDNILFDKQFDPEYYEKIIDACALREDLQLLSAGDLTEIGEKGINLSGGQKARVALARAVYQQADLYVLDDTLSAVDSHVGSHIFEQVIGKGGLLSKATRLFALNTLAFLRHCDRIVVMSGGRIHAIGTLNELKQKREGPFTDLMREFLEKQAQRKQRRSSQFLEDDTEDDDRELEEILKNIAGSPLSEGLLERRNLADEISPEMAARVDDTFSSSHGRSSAITIPKQTKSIASRRRTTTSTSSELQDIMINGLEQLDQRNINDQHPLTHQQQQILAQLNAGRLIEEEEVPVGKVNRKVYIDYGRVFGWWLVIGFLVSLFFGSSTFEAMSRVWLAKWTTDASQPNATMQNSDTILYLGIFGGFGIMSAITTAISGVILAVGAYRASTSFHDDLVHSLFRSPMAFFDRTPLGRIINRLSSDIDRVDENVPLQISFTFIILAEAVNSLIAIVIVIPILIIVVIPMLVAFFIISHYYNIASVQFRRLVSKTWSSMCSLIHDAYIGADSIRVFNAVEKFREEVCRLADLTTESVLIECITNRWIQIRLDFLTDIAVFIFVFVAIILANQHLITLGALAMVISSGYSFTGFLGEIARNWREVETNVVCIERIGEYIGNEPEAEWRVGEANKPQIHSSASTSIGENLWPSAGRIEFRDFCFRYRETSDLVLKNLNFTIEGGEKVGIVGRTGAGKTSLTLALFRIVEPSSGTILIDWIDFNTLGLHDLREALTIIPQDPVLFCGTFRSNLDPFDEFSDDEIWLSLEKAHLKDVVSGFEAGLSHEIAESGSNLSVGQRQLVCLARALLRHNTKILILDEATAAIDAETDRLIQLSIRENFKNCTILTIAHRLDTVMDYDRILVMNAGEVAEFDKPNILLQNPNSIFSSLARHACISGRTAAQ